MLSSEQRIEDDYVNKLLEKRHESQKRQENLKFWGAYALLGFTSIIVVRIQSLDYPHHANLKRTLKEIFRNDLTRLRFLYLGLFPMVVSMGILALSSAIAISAKEFLHNRFSKSQKEKREFFKKIDWSQPEKIADDLKGVKT